MIACNGVLLIKIGRDKALAKIGRSISVLLLAPCLAFPNNILDEWIDWNRSPNFRRHRRRKWHIFIQARQLPPVLDDFAG